MSQKGEQVGRWWEPGNTENEDGGGSVRGWEEEEGVK